MGYVNPFTPDCEDPLHWKKQGRKDYVAAKAEGGMDAAIAASKRRERPDLLEGFERIPGASRSGALAPHVKSKFFQREERGEVELQRDESGQLIGWRPKP